MESSQEHTKDVHSCQPIVFIFGIGVVAERVVQLVGRSGIVVVAIAVGIVVVGGDPGAEMQSTMNEEAPQFFTSPIA